MIDENEGFDCQEGYIYLNGVNHAGLFGIYPNNRSWWHITFSGNLGTT
jgi:hypothetical protein